MKRILSLVLVASMAFEASAQQKLTREQILAMSTDQLSELPLEDLMDAVETLGVSSVDELFALIMNKNVSSASKQEENSFTSPLSTTVITHDEMRTYGVSSIEEAFRLIPGMIVTEKTNGVYDIQMRGLNNIPDNNMLLYTENPNTLVMIDGRPVNNLAMGAVNFDMLPIDIEDVDRIEVVRGAASALYGANAVTGVINILTKKPDMSDEVVSGNIQMGSHNTFVGNMAFRKAFNSSWAVGVTVNMQHRARPTSQLYVIPQAGVYLASSAAPEVGSTFTKEQLAASIGSGALTDMTKGGYLDASQLDNLRQLYQTTDNSQNLYTIYRCLEPETPAANMFDDPGLARKTEGYNGYLTFTPTDDVRFDLTGGYQRSYVNTTPVGDDYFSFNGRESKTGYVALSATIKGVHFLANYSGGPQDYAVGVPGFKVYTNNLNLSAEYDIKVGDLGIRPGVNWQYVRFDDYVPAYDNLKNGYSWTYQDPGYKYDEADKQHLSGFFNYSAKVTAVAPSLRLDYRKNDFRLIAAFRSDKTNIPDKWNPSWQLSANYRINEANFVRLVYGRANRSAIMVNSNVNFLWTRTQLLMPNRLQFSADPEADLVRSDNFEVGYRLNPSPALLIDAEAFFSHSTDFGALMANSGYISVDENDLKNVMTGQINVAELLGNLKTFASIKYGELPYKVNQFGLSFNVDWIISPKLIAKLNMNIQKTIINDYYQYSQSRVIQELLKRSSTSLQGEMAGFMRKMSEINSNETLSDDDKKAEFSKLVASSLERLQKYYNSETGTYDLSDNNAEQIRQDVHDGKIDHDDSLARNFGTVREDGVENKATPNVYGMLGLVYKPMQQLNVAAFANYIGKRSYATKYNSDGEKLAQRFTVNLKLGYSPKDNVEVFFNAHNLFNNKKREFVYSDEIPGIYTVGVNFGL